MPFVYADVDDLEGTSKVGGKQCVALLQHYSKLPQTLLWKEGANVVGNLSTKKGTAIATFSDGKYLNNGTGNHAAYYVSQDAAGIVVMDQWRSDVQKPTVSTRYLRRKGRSAKGELIDPSNNADAYSVIE